MLQRRPSNSVGNVPLLSSRPLALVFVRMDELAAAAAVVAMPIDDNAEEDAALDVIDGSAIAAHAQARAVAGEGD